LNAVDFAFIQHVSEHNLSYGTVEEFNFRKNVFAAKDELIKEFNQTESSSVHVHNKFSTWTEDEMSRLLGRFPRSAEERGEITMLEETNATSWDWRSKGAVTPVKDQGQCGSCWSFSATGGVEGSYLIATGKLIPLSEEELVQCVPRLGYGCAGCNGGWEDRAMGWVKDNGGITTETDYPYTSGTGTTGSCNTGKLGDVSATVKNVVEVTANSYNQMHAAVQAAPTTIAIAASTWYFQSYSTGVLTNETRCGTTVDHAVLAVGFGTDSTYGDYYIVKNSWNTTWGDQGYVKLGTTGDGPGVCQVQSEPAYAQS